MGGDIKRERTREIVDDVRLRSSGEETDWVRNTGGIKSNRYAEHLTRSPSQLTERDTSLHLQVLMLCVVSFRRAPYAGQETAGQERGMEVKSRWFVSLLLVCGLWGGRW